MLAWTNHEIYTYMSLVNENIELKFNKKIVKNILSEVSTFAANRS